MTVFSNRLIVVGSLLISAVSAAAFSQSSPDDAGGTVAPGIETSWRVTVTPVGVPIAPFLHVQHIRPRWNVPRVEPAKAGSGPRRLAANRSARVWNHLREDRVQRRRECHRHAQSSRDHHVECGGRLIYR
jgi:hypothetical protein